MIVATRPTTALRLLGAFAAILALFGAALAVTLVALGRIGQAEAEVAALDHAKHAGHTVAAQVRELYIHQAHTIINGDTSHLGHYDEVLASTREWTRHLLELATSPEERVRAEELERLAGDADREFRAGVLGAIALGDRARILEGHARVEALVNRVVAVNEELNRIFEGRSAAARARADSLRARARVVMIAFFALALVIATALGAVLMRSILGPIRRLRSGAERVGAGDLSHRIEVRGRDEFAELATAFNEMTAALARHQEELVRTQKLASVGQLAAGVAHEINNPLGVILGYVKLLRREPGVGGREELAIIEDEARECQRIVEGLLDVARPPRLDLTSVDLAAVAREAVERLSESGKLGRSTVAVPDDGVAVLARADEAKVRQVIVNLLTNAAEATRERAPEDGPTIRVEVEARGDEAVLRVCDDGPGIPAETRDRVFEPFFTTKPRGTGLGLAIAQAIADAHGGRLELESEPGRGTRVTLRIPAARAEAA